MGLLHSQPELRGGISFGQLPGYPGPWHMTHSETVRQYSKQAKFEWGFFSLPNNVELLLKCKAHFLFRFSRSERRDSTLLNAQVAF
jgi:hypothetical protein